MKKDIKEAVSMLTEDKGISETKVNELSTW